ncbi:MAG: hypothetical protein FIB06_01585 [Betaproteobacteria bacterium]|nr:hypothetical protein [Betaproteobacteria bacterium]
MSDDQIVERARQILYGRLTKAGMPEMEFGDLGVLAGMHLAGRTEETLVVFWLDSEWRLLGFEELAIGDETGCRISTRSISRKAVAANAAMACFFHNHPTGSATASHADKVTAGLIDERMAAIGVFVIGNFVVCGNRIECIRTGHAWDLISTEQNPCCPTCKQGWPTTEASPTQGEPS